MHKINESQKKKKKKDERKRNYLSAKMFLELTELSEFR